MLNTLRAGPATTHEIRVRLLASWGYQTIPMPTRFAVRRFLIRSVSSGRITASDRANSLEYALTDAGMAFVVDFAEGTANCELAIGPIELPRSS